MKWIHKRVLWQRKIKINKLTEGFQVPPVWNEKVINAIKHTKKLLILSCTRRSCWCHQVHEVTDSIKYMKKLLMLSSTWKDYWCYQVDEELLNAWASWIHGRRNTCSGWIWNTNINYIFEWYLRHGYVLIDIPNSVFIA